MKVPYERFICYLITLRHSRNEINRTLKTHGFSTINDEYYKQLVAIVELPDDFCGVDRRHISSMRCLERLKIQELWLRPNGDKAKLIYTILGKPRLREIVDAMVVSPATYDEIGRSLKEHFSFVATAEVVAIYASLFCDYHGMTELELRGYVDSSGEYWRLDAARGDVGLLRYHLGLQAKISVDQVAQRVMQISYAKISELGHQGTDVDGAKAFGEYLKGVTWAAEQLKASEDNLSKLTDALTLDYDKSKDPQYEESLPEANVTSLLPEPSDDVPAETFDAPTG